jgi:prepilin-type processing-associated H-X9-DG protein
VFHVSESVHNLPEKKEPKFQYRLRTLLLLPVAMAVVGAVGVWVGWGAVLLLTPILLGTILLATERVTISQSIAIVAFLYVLIALIAPAFQRVRITPGGPRCPNNLKQILVSMYLYRDDYGVYPPAYLTDESGRPAHSWRVLLLPYFDEHMLYDKYRFDEPWDGPNNRQLASEIIAVYNCPSAPSSPSTDTSYLLVTGKGTAWEEDWAPDFPDVPDGISNTIAVVEVANSGIHWMEPRDLDIDHALRGLNAPAGLCIRSHHPGGASVAMCDGSVHFLPDTISAKSLKALTTAAGEDTPGRDW